MGVVGLGRAGWDIHVRAIRGRKDFLLTDVVDLEQSRLEEARAEFGCRTHRDFRAFLRDSEAELAVIATQSKDHAWMSWEALEAGKHVLSEKPMATRLRDVDRVLAAAKASRRLFTVHQNARLAPDLRHVQEVIRSGLLGRVFMIKRGSYSFGRRNDWQTLRKYGGGQLNNNGVHMVDQVLQLLDSPVKAVFGDLQQILNPGDTEDHVKVVIRAESGMVADVEVSTACAVPPPAWVVMGDRGTLISDGKTSRLRYYLGRRLRPLKPVDSHMVATRSYGIGETIEFKEETLPSASPWPRDFYDYLYDSIRKGKPLLVTGESVRNTMYVLQEARKGTAFR
jgi:predicted dehydrogenase